MNAPRVSRAPMGRHLGLLGGSLVLCLLAAEITMRWLDPFPYYPPEQINHSYHGNLSMYDSLLGWRGVPEASATITTHNNRFQVHHNAAGFRDVEHGDTADHRPAIVLLGDSFAWGYEVDAQDMFAELLRRELADHVLFNLAHNGYGTDQSLLTFRYWSTRNRLDRVILVFTENDVDDNNARRRYYKNKPKFELMYGQLLLTGVPVERDEAWNHPQRTEAGDTAAAPAWQRWVFRSHLFHDLYYRIGSLFRSNPPRPPAPPPDLERTSALLRELKREVRRRGGELLVILVPSKGEIDHLTKTEPYQHAIAARCQELEIAYLDLAPAFHDTWLRTYYRLDMHWNPRGHRVAAKALTRYLLTH